MTQEFHLSITPLSVPPRQPGAGADPPAELFLIRTERVAPGVPLAEEQVRWPLGDWLATAERLMGEPLRSLLTTDPRPPRALDSLDALGQALYDAVFQGTIRDSWMTAQGIAQNRGEELRLRLGLKGDRLPGLPWEAIAGEGRSLATGKDVTFSRYQSQFTPRPALPAGTSLGAVERPLRVLVAIATPDDQARLELQQEVSQLKAELLRQSPSEDGGGAFPLTDRDPDPIQIDILEQPDRETLTRTLEQGNYHIFHYAGHSSWGDRGGCLHLVNQNTGLTEIFSGEDLAGLLANNGIILALLNSCRGSYTAAAATTQDATDNLAAALIRRGIPSVLAMAEQIPDDVALILAQLFYRNLRQGLAIDSSLNRARQGLVSAYGSNQLYWALPILYLHPDFDGHLLAPAADLRAVPPPRPGRPPAAPPISQKSPIAPRFAPRPPLGQAGTGNRPAAIAPSHRPAPRPSSHPTGDASAPAAGHTAPPDHRAPWAAPAPSRLSAAGSDRRPLGRAVPPPAAAAPATPVTAIPWLHQLAQELGQTDRGDQPRIPTQAAPTGPSPTRPTFSLSPDAAPEREIDLATADPATLTATAVATLPRPADPPRVTARRPPNLTVPPAPVRALPFSQQPWAWAGLSMGLAAVGALGLWAQLRPGALPRFPVPVPRPHGEAGWERVNRPRDPQSLAQVPTDQLVAQAVVQFNQDEFAGAIAAVQALLAPERNAIAAAQTALKAAPETNDFPEITFLRGRVAWQSLRVGETLFGPDDARRYWQAAVDGDPEQPHYWLALGFAHYRAGDWGRSRQAWLQTLKLTQRQDPAVALPAAPNTPFGEPATEITLQAEAGLALVSWRQAQAETRPDRRLAWLGQAIAHRQRVLTVDAAAMQPQALLQNWLWTEGAIADWQQILDLRS